MPRRLADTSQGARAMLGFEAEVSLDEGLRGLVDVVATARRHVLQEAVA